MASEGRASLPGHSGRLGVAGSGATRIVPLYKRLPHGPHRLDRTTVIRHQRMRIHGAMVEAVAEHGYWGTSVKQVIGLAGVSRRSFYEQFANKQDCFLETFDLLAGRGVQRVSRAYLAGGGGAEDRLKAAFEELAEAADTDRKAAALVVLEAQTAGTAGWLRLRTATAACEQLLRRSLVASGEAAPLPAPIVRGVAGGLHGALSWWLREEHGGASTDLAAALLSWTLLFQTPASEHMAERIAERLSRRMRSTAASGERADHGQPSRRDERRLLLQNTLRLAVVGDYRNLTAPQIADESGVSIDAFFELFAGKGECFLAALDMLADELLKIAAIPDLDCADWPQAARGAIDELLRYLADHPLYAQTLAREAFAAGPDAVTRNLELARDVATLLTAGAPEPADRSLAVEGIAGAIWHLVRCQVAGGRIRLLPALSDYLAYIVLAPFIGADAAVEALAEDRAA